LRADFYGLLGRLLAGAADAETLAACAALKGDASELGVALGVLAKAAASADPAAVEREYFDLFIGVGRGELLPFGSFYLTGFLNEKPLARLRQDLARHGIARRAGVFESEDHIAALCQAMATLIGGESRAPVALAEQQTFFDRHLAPWAGRFFADLETAEKAAFYRPVGTIGRLFVEIESQAFRMAA